MAAIPARLHSSPAATCTATMLRNIGEEDGIGMPRTTTPSSVMRSWLKIAPSQHPLRRAEPRGGRRSCHRGMHAASLLDHLIGPCQQRLRDRQAQRLGRLQVDDQLELGRLLDWYISRFGTLQNLVDEDSGTSPVVKKIRGIGHEASSLDKEAIFIHGGEPVLDGELRSLIRIMGTEEKL